jgi:hypothetical protein
MNSKYFLCRGMSHIIGLTLNYIKFGKEKKKKKGMSTQSLTIILNLDISNLG